MPIPTEGATLPAYDEIVAIWPAADGFDAAAEARDSVLYHGNTLLHTTDGRAWTRLTPAPLPDGVKSGEDIYSHAGVATADGRRIVWQTQEPMELLTTLSTSADGILWMRVPTVASTGAFIELALAPAVGSTGPWLLLGGSATGERWWRSDDMLNWQSDYVVFTGIPRAGLSAITRLGGGYVAVGLEQFDDYTTIPVTLTSRDGAHWAFVEGSVPAPQDGPIFMVDGPAGLVGIGTTDTASAAWLGTDLRR